VIPIHPTAVPGAGSRIKPRITAEKIAKEYYAFGGRPSG
jgi:hypothetical protein